MSAAAIPKKVLAEWRDLLSPPELQRLTTAALLCFASCLVIPFCAIEGVALLYIAVCACFFYAQTGRLSSLLAPAIPAVLLYSLSGTLLLPAAFFALVFGGALGGLLLISLKKWQRLALLLIPALAYLAAFLVKGDARNALLVLLPVTVALACGAAVYFFRSFTDAVVLIALAIAAALGVAGAVTLALYGLLDASLLPALLDAVHAELMATMAQMQQAYAELGTAITLSSAELKTMLAMLVNLSPAIFGVVCIVTAFFAWRTLLVLLCSFGLIPRVPLHMGVPAISAVTAVLFMLSYLAAMIADGTTVTFAGAVFRNLALLLEPGLAYIGFHLLLRRDEERSCLSVLVLIGVVFLLWQNPGAAIALAAFFGAIHILIFTVKRSRRNKGEQ